MEERFAYGLNPQKLGAVSSHLCDPATAAAEFLLVKSGLALPLTCFSIWKSGPWIWELQVIQS